MAGGYGKDKPRKPVEAIRFGTLSASIWRNQGKDGAWYSVSFQRSYKDNDGDWNYSDTFNLHDLCELSLLAQRAFGAIQSLTAKDRANKAEVGSDDDDADDADDADDDKGEGKPKQKDDAKPKKKKKEPGKTDDGEEIPY